MEARAEISEPTMVAFGRYKAGVPPVRYRPLERKCDDPHLNFELIRTLRPTKREPDEFCPRV